MADMEPGSIADRIRNQIFADIVAERARQDEKFPNELVLPYDLTPSGGRETWMKLAQLACDRAQREGRLTHNHIIDEESAELLNARTREELRTEAIQTAACCVKLVEQLDHEDQISSPGHDVSTPTSMGIHRPAGAGENTGGEKGAGAKTQGSAVSNPREQAGSGDGKTVEHQTRLSVPAPDELCVCCATFAEHQARERGEMPTRACHSFTPRQRPAEPRPICETPGCGRPIPIGGEGCPEICPDCLVLLEIAERHANAEENDGRNTEPVILGALRELQDRLRGDAERLHAEPQDIDGLARLLMEKGERADSLDHLLDEDPPEGCGR